jgi:hypothetical protein
MMQRKGKIHKIKFVLAIEPGPVFHLSDAVFGKMRDAVEHDFDSGLVRCL